MRNFKVVFTMLILSFTLLATVLPVPAFAQGPPPGGPPPGAYQPPTMPQSIPDQMQTVPDQMEAAPQQMEVAPEQANPGTPQQPNTRPQQMEALPSPAQAKGLPKIAALVLDGSELSLSINKSCYSTYYVNDSIQFSVNVGDWSQLPQQSWWRWLEVWGSTNGEWWHPIVSGRWVEPSDSIVQSARIGRPVGDELLYARLLDVNGNEVAWKTCAFTSSEYNAPVVTQDPVVKLLQTGYGNDFSVVQNALVFRVKAYDPAVGMNDGDGIAYVKMEIYNSQGYKVSSKTENYAGYCAFGGGVPHCSVYNFAHKNYRWPNGMWINYGEYTLKATAYTPDGRSATLQKVITIQ